jgi:hypothetical protein
MERLGIARELKPLVFIPELLIFNYEILILFLFSRVVRLFRLTIFGFTTTTQILLVQTKPHHTRRTARNH